MLLKLEKYWIGKWYFIKKPLWLFSEAKKDWFQHITEDFIDFDQTWKHFSSLALKTADALKFCNKKRLQFIEFKNIEDIWDIKEHITGLYLNLKVQESFQLLRNILNEKPFWTKDNRNKFNKIKSEFIFSITCTCLDPRITLLLDMEISWLEDYDITLERVIWIEATDLIRYT